MQEVKAGFDYVSVINTHLLKILEVRSRLHEEGKGIILYNSGTKVVRDSLLYNIRTYYDHVRSLYAVLLPDLRGKSSYYLDIAYKLILNIIKKLRLETKIKEEVGYLYKESEVEEAKKKLERVNSKIENLLNNLPEEDLENIKDIDNHSRVIYLIDRGLEEIITKLNNAGLLMRSNKISKSPIEQT